MMESNAIHATRSPRSLQWIVSSAFRIETYDAIGDVGPAETVGDFGDLADAEEVYAVVCLSLVSELEKI
jgi:hypothetical protein